ncbi:nuclear distribution protein NudE [Aspergillus chevalieri]|uniref:NADH:ubiquinone oxidoreductase n=1 Tax=Aspergillus chevalieri TaxID=182096 RepID=A0A7R7VR20_ASPCH|nr:NADH:ubiquinone oxidoreductase [Aspergillus chevalieri]BCR89204.1 NADH:ubiquinone oxidoreductase [Aspergillus chevalieri]
MPSADDSAKRPNGTSSRGDELAYYKAQYEQLESELADFQASSRDLEAELEKDIEASEKRERKLKEKVEALGYEVEEWKTKCKQSKTEGNSAQNTLQKEITTLRDANRTLHLKLRDIEVANDDYERQARNTTSSLEDLEYKYNAAIERGVLLEEEIKNGDQEREQLRIENQRLRDELSDLKIETEIVQEKLRNAEMTTGRRIRRPTPLYRSPSTPQTPEIFDRSPGTSIISSPLFNSVNTTPTKLTMASATATPPSPPISESSSSMRKSINGAPNFPRLKASAGEPLTSRTLHASRSSQRLAHSRATSAFANGNRSSTLSASSRTSVPRSNHSFHNSTSSLNGSTTNGAGRTLAKSGSLCQIRGLIGKMQKLEERVQSAKSKLPPPSESPSRASSRAGSAMGSAMGDSPVASTITVRRDSRNRRSGSSFSSSVRDGDSVPSYLTQSRPSFSTRTPGDSRPSSRTSFSSRSSVSHTTHPSVTLSTRPESRQSRTKTPLGHYSTNPMTEGRRPRSSLSNHTAQSSIVSGMSNIDEDEGLAKDFAMRATISECRGTRLPSVTAMNGTWKKRSTSGIPAPRSLKTSIGVEEGTRMSPPERKPALADLGETF